MSYYRLNPSTNLTLTKEGEMRWDSTLKRILVRINGAVQQLNQYGDPASGITSTTVGATGRYATIAAAVTAGEQFIRVNSNVTETTTITTAAPTLIWLDAGVTVTTTKPINVDGGMYVLGVGTWRHDPVADADADELFIATANTPNFYAETMTFEVGNKVAAASLFGATTSQWNDICFKNSYITAVDTGGGTNLTNVLGNSGLGFSFFDGCNFRAISNIAAWNTLPTRTVFLDSAFEMSGAPLSQLNLTAEYLINCMFSGNDMRVNPTVLAKNCLDTEDPTTTTYDGATVGAIYKNCKFGELRGLEPALIENCAFSGHAGAIAGSGVDCAMVNNRISGTWTDNASETNNVNYVNCLFTNAAVGAHTFQGGGRRDFSGCRFYRDVTVATSIADSSKMEGCLLPDKILTWDANEGRILFNSFGALGSITLGASSTNNFVHGNNVRGTITNNGTGNSLSQNDEA